MIACSCRAVREHVVRVAVATGARSLSEISERCGAGSACGGCHLLLEEILAQAAIVTTDEHAA